MTSNGYTSFYLSTHTHSCVKTLACTCGISSEEGENVSAFRINISWDQRITSAAHHTLFCLCGINSSLTRFPGAIHPSAKQPHARGRWTPIRFPSSWISLVHPSEARFPFLRLPPEPICPSPLGAETVSYVISLYRALPSCDKNMTLSGTAWSTPKEERREMEGAPRGGNKVRPKRERKIKNVL